MEGILITCGTNAFIKDSDNRPRKCFSLFPGIFLLMQAHICHSGERVERDRYCLSRRKLKGWSYVVTFATKSFSQEGTFTFQSWPCFWTYQAKWNLVSTSEEFSSQKREKKTSRTNYNLWRHLTTSILDAEEMGRLAHKKITFGLEGWKEFQAKKRVFQI